MTTPVGIDLGTTFSAIAYVNKMGKPEIISNREGERITPSAVLFEDGQPIVGTIAKNASVADPDNVIQFVKRQMGNPDYVFVESTGKEYSPVDLSAMILTKLKRDAETFLGEEIRHAVITVPAYFDDVRRRNTINAGQVAGLEVMKIVNEPTAAAMAYGLDKKGAEETVLVYDLGGGTFDVTVIRIGDKKIEVIATEGDHALGGFDFDNCIMEIFEKTFQQQAGVSLYDDSNTLQDLREKSEAAKKILSSRAKVTQFFTAAGQSQKIELTRDRFEEAISSLLGRTETLLDIVLGEANLTWNSIDRVLMVGGSTRIPAVLDMVKRVTGKEPDISVNPDECVAMGAAIQAAMEAAKTIPKKERGQKGARIPDIPEYSDVLAHALGIVILDERQIAVNKVMIPKNTTYPARSKDTFYTAFDDQDEVEVVPLQGDDENPEFCNPLGSAVMKVPPRPAGQPIEVTYDFDDNQILWVTAVDINTGETINPRFEPKGKMSDDEIQKRQKALSQIADNL